MYGIYTYIYHKNQPNVGIYTIHGSYGIVICPASFQRFIVPLVELSGFQGEGSVKDQIIQELSTLLNLLGQWLTLLNFLGLHIW